MTRATRKSNLFPLNSGGRAWPGGDFATELLQNGISATSVSPEFKLAHYQAS
jgi:hypothetical protein